MMGFPSINPLEIRSRIHQHSYDSIPEIPSNELSPEDKARILLPTSSNAAATKAKYRNRSAIARTMGCIVVTVCSIAVISTRLESSSRKSPTRPHFVPTLLSVFDPKDGYVYALNCSLYNTVSNADFIDVDDSRWSGHELPRLFLDRTTISVEESITVAWSMGRDGESGNVLLKEDDIIALYCVEADARGNRFLEAATVSQARATSVRDGGHGDSWFIPSFPILRQDECHFRLYADVTGDDEASPRRRLVKMAATEPLTISAAKETPTAIHLALTESFSRMIIQFTTGEVSTHGVTKAVPVVRYYKVPSDAVRASPENIAFVQGTSDTYAANDLCSAPANQEVAGKYYPPGLLHTMELDNLERSTTYEYQVGLSVNGSVVVWSDRARFTSPPEVGSRGEFSYIVYGDQGCPETGCGEGLRWIEAMAEREPMATAVHHFGDIR
jgi:hypothetical protein